jgi:hypothetical protein
MSGLTLAIEQGQHRTRVTTFFRWILVIPHLLFAAIWEFGALLAAIVAWFSIVFTGRYPDGLWDFNAGFVRYYARVTLYAFLVVDEFPPFNGGPDAYQVQLDVPKLAVYDRLTTLLRLLYALPAYIVAGVLSYVMVLVGFVAWLVIIVTGDQPAGLQRALIAMSGWLIRVAALLTLVSGSYDLEVRS